eukprot:9044962-Alexandrium_andersonii.AAC.1
MGGGWGVRHEAPGARNNRTPDAVARPVLVWLESRCGLRPKAPDARNSRTPGAPDGAGKLHPAENNIILCNSALFGAIRRFQPHAASAEQRPAAPSSA